MTREDIDNLISVICPNDEDFEKPIISPAYLKKELETLALEQEPNTKKDLGVDCISREQALEPYKILENTDTLSVYTIRQNLAELSSVTPQEPKTGHWKVVSDGYGDNAYICECSECKDTVWVYKDTDRKWNFCPNCGAKMVEPQESEVQNGRVEI